MIVYPTTNRFSKIVTETAAVASPFHSGMTLPACGRIMIIID